MSRWYQYIAWKPILIILALVVAGTTLYFSSDVVHQQVDETLARLSDQQQLQEWVDQLGWLGPIAIIVLMTVQLFLLFLPSVILMVVSILAYGPVYGSLLALIATLVAAACAYVLGRWLGAESVSRLLGEKATERTSFYLDTYGHWAVAIARFSPFMSNDLVSVVAGLLKMRFLPFMFATAAGTSPLIAIFAFFEEDIESMQWALLLASVLGLAALGLKVWTDQKYGRGYQRGN